MHEHRAPGGWVDVLAHFQPFWDRVVRAVQHLPPAAPPEEGDAVFWECAPLHPAALQRCPKFVLAPAHELRRTTADPGPFAEHLQPAPPEVGAVAFHSLGGDARLVAPTPEHPDTDYAHLTAFLRTAPAAQIAALGSLVGDTLADALADGTPGWDGPLWLSTSGLGVAWLHVRIDTRPKYYVHAPYRAYPKPTP